MGSQTPSTSTDCALSRACACFRLDSTRQPETRSEKQMHGTLGRFVLRRQQSRSLQQYIRATGRFCPVLREAAHWALFRRTIPPCRSNRDRCVGRRLDQISASCLASTCQAAKVRDLLSQCPHRLVCSRQPCVRVRACVVDTDEEGARCEGLRRWRGVPKLFRCNIDVGTEAV